MVTTSTPCLKSSAYPLPDSFGFHQSPIAGVIEGAGGVGGVGVGVGVGEEGIGVIGVFK
jgi:hypothetical protein